MSSRTRRQSIHLLLLITFFASDVMRAKDLSDDECAEGLRVEGRGWHDPELMLPSRYFFVRIPDGCDKEFFDVLIQSPMGPKDCQVKVQVLRQTLLKFVIVRYRLLSTSCPNGLSIRISDRKTGRVISCKDIESEIRGEDCKCLSPDFSERMGCPSALRSSRIFEDLSPFQREAPHNFSVWLLESVRRFAGYPRSYSFCHYKIISNEIYRKCYGEYVGFSMFFDEFLKSLARKTLLPNTQFLVNLGDWPLASRQGSLLPIPFFSWCGSTETYDIVIPTYEMTESVLQAQARVSVDVLGVMGQQKTGFDDKIPKAFFRGRDSNRIRLLLVLYSKRTPEVVDAAITNFFFFREPQELQQYGPTVKHMSLYDFFEYKYLVSIDGTVAAYRVPNLLSGSSMVLKQRSKYYEHFYHLLEPDKHFIELREDLTDFYDTMNRLTNSSAADYIPSSDQLEIVKHATQLIVDHVMATNIYCYYFNLITEYSKLLAGRAVEVEDGDEHVTNPSQTCDCTHLKSPPVKGEL